MDSQLESFNENSCYLLTTERVIAVIVVHSKREAKKLLLYLTSTRSQILIETLCCCQGGDEQRAGSASPITCKMENIYIFWLVFRFTLIKTRDLIFVVFHNRT